MQLPKSHTPHKVTKKNRFQKKVDESTSQQVNEKSNFRIFEISKAEAIVLNFSNFLTP